MSSKVFSNRNLCHSIISFLDTPMQVRCLRINRSTKAYVEDLQTRMRPEQAKKIAALFSQEIVDTVGGMERLLKAPVLNLIDSHFHTSNLRPECFKGPFVIGVQGTVPFLACKVHYLAENCCGSTVVKRTTLVVAQGWGSNFFSGDLIVATLAGPRLDQLSWLFQGKSIQMRLPIAETEVENYSCCCTCSEACAMLLYIFNGHYRATLRTYKLVLGS